MQAYIHMAINIIVIIACLNWGLVAYNGTDMVKIATQGNELAEKYVKLAIGIVGLYIIYAHNIKHFV